MPDVEMANGFVASNGVSKATPTYPAFHSIPDCIRAFAAGDFVIVLDSPDRENEADLILAAAYTTPSKLSFMIRYSSGYICAPIPSSRAAALHLPQMVSNNADPNRTAYTITVDANDASVTTGISATDRALTCRNLADDNVGPDGFRRPGHIVPLQARDGGVRARRGHTEAAVEFCRLARLPLAGVICELVTDGEEVPGKAERFGGGMMRTEDALTFGKRWNIPVCTIEDLVKYVEGGEGKLPGVDAVDY